MELLSFEEAAPPPELREQVVALQRVMGPGFDKVTVGALHLRRWASPARL